MSITLFCISLSAACFQACSYTAVRVWGGGGAVCEGHATLGQSSKGLVSWPALRSGKNRPAVGPWGGACACSRVTPAALFMVLRGIGCKYQD